MKYLLLILITTIFYNTSLFSQFFQIKTAQAGIRAAYHTNGVAVADYDLDGDLDFYITAMKQYDPSDETTWSRLYRNNGDKTFSDVTSAAGVAFQNTGFENGAMGNNFSATWGDYDNDGDPDLVVTGIGPDQLFRNEANGTFANITQTAGIAGDNTENTTSAVWWDYDLDGDLDLYISAWIGVNRMYENLGNDQFADVTLSAALNDSGRTWTSIPIDANDDGLLDLYVVNDFGPNKFYVNLGNNSFREATAEFGLEDVGHGMGVCIGDYNNDSFFDIYLTNISFSHPCPLFTNSGDGYFVENGAELGVHNTGWAWGTEFFDCDHDGDVELYVVNGNVVEGGENFFFNNMTTEGSGGFFDVSQQSGANGGFEARGLVVFDYDNDGDLDMLVANWHAEPYLYENETITKNWLKIQLQGTESNRDGFGAIVSLTINGKTTYRHNDGVEFLGQSVQPIHFGMGEATIAEQIFVRWPNGREEFFYDIAANQTVTFVEGQGIVTAIEDALTSEIPRKFELLGNFPNPFNGSTIIEFALPRAGSVSVSIYNTLGKKVYSQQKQYAAAGKYAVNWNGENRAGLPVASGIYIYQIKFKEQVESGKMLYLK